MCLKNSLLPLLAALLFFAGTVNGQLRERRENEPGSFQEELNERDFEALKEFLNAKKAGIDFPKKGCGLVIRGDVRTEWRHMTEKQNGVSLRGPDTFHSRIDNRGYFIRRGPRSKNDFDIECNMKFDYKCERTWAHAHLKYDNSAGVQDNDEDCLVDPEGYHGSGDCDDICLKKAYFGYLLCENKCSRFEVEIGRRGNLYDAFDSKVQFLSRFDGILFHYKSRSECIGNWYWKVAGFVVDQDVNHFAWATELGLLNICETGIDFKYSFIHWKKYGKNFCGVADPAGFRCMNSQFQLAYNFQPDILLKPARIYGAYLINHDSPRRAYLFREHNASGHGFHDVIRHARKNKAWYVGFLIGDVRKEGDWSIEVQYQLVQAFSMPDDDVSGIGRGNVLGTTLTGLFNGPNGNTNYKGWRFEALYALTDNISVDHIIEFSQAEDAKIGGSHSYSKVEIETIYAF